MQKGNRIYWETDVLHAWRRASGNVKRPNSDVWGKLPQGVHWFRATLELADIPKMFVIGSGDWKKVFGTYHLIDIAANSAISKDKYGHLEKFKELQSSISNGKCFEPLILVSSSIIGPYVIIDGNHRAIALHRLGLLEHQQVFLGIHKGINSEFVWYRQAIAM